MLQTLVARHSQQRCQKSALARLEEDRQIVLFYERVRLTSCRLEVLKNRVLYASKLNRSARGGAFLGRSGLLSSPVGVS